MYIANIHVCFVCASFMLPRVNGVLLNISRGFVDSGQGGSGSGAGASCGFIQPGDGRMFSGYQPGRAGRCRCLLMPRHQRRRTGHLHSQRRRRPYVYFCHNYCNKEFDLTVTRRATAYISFCFSCRGLCVAIP